MNSILTFYKFYILTFYKCKINIYKYIYIYWFVHKCTCENADYV